MRGNSRDSVMGKLSFRFRPGRSAGGGRGRRRGGGGAVPPYLVLAEPPFLLLTLIRIGLGGGAAARAGEDGVSVEAAEGRVLGVSPSLPPFSRLFVCGVCVCGVCVGGLIAGTFGRSPAGRGAGGGTRFLLPPRGVSYRCVSSCFSAVTTGGGTRSLTRYQPRPGWRGGGVGGGTEGEGRNCYSSAGFRSRYRPFGATNLKLAPRVPLKFCVW